MTYNIIDWGLVKEISFYPYRCNLHCNEGWYGKNCAQKCTCLNGGRCDHITGKCNCTAGWQVTNKHVMCN